MQLRDLPLPTAASTRALATCVLGAMLLAGCGDKKDTPSTQAAAKVNKEELTVHQINAVLARQRPVAPAQADEAARRVLEGLIDQELAVQKAAEMRLDRDPRVVQAIEAMRREIIARAYMEKIGEGAGRPSPAEVKTYYEGNPALFRERRIYRLQEYSVQAPPEQVTALVERAQSAKAAAPDLAHVLRAADLKFSGGPVVRAAEQVPLDRLPQLAALKDGQAMVVPAPGGASVVQVVASRLQPIDEARATPAIEQFLLNDRRRKLVTQDLKSLRSAAKIEYLGSFATGQRPRDEATPSIAAAVSSAAAGIGDKDEGAHPGGAPVADGAASSPAAVGAASGGHGVGSK